VLTNHIEESKWMPSWGGSKLTATQYCGLVSGGSGRNGGYRVFLATLVPNSNGQFDRGNVDRAEGAEAACKSLGYSDFNMAS
jgi:hypothetical protein